MEILWQETQVLIACQHVKLRVRTSGYNQEGLSIYKKQNLWPERSRQMFVSLKRTSVSGLWSEVVELQTENMKPSFMYV